MENELKEFIAGMSQADKEEIGEEVSLLSTGLVDSLGLVHLVAFVEEKYGIRVGPMDLTPENFDTVSRIAAYIRARIR